MIDPGPAIGRDAANDTSRAYRDDSRWRRRLLVAAIFAVAEIVMVRRTPTELSHQLVSNLGDPALIVWTLRWDGHALLHYPLSMFNANIYSPYPHTLAYADDLISIAPLYNFLYALTHNWSLSLNLLWLGDLALNMGATYSLTRWLTRRTEAGVFAGLAAGFSAFIWSQVGHQQLQVIGLIPLGLLLLFKLLERPRISIAVGLGVVNVAILLGAQYWAAFYVVAVIVVLGGWTIAVRGRLNRAMVVPMLVAGAITLIAAPTAIPFRDVQKVEGKRALTSLWSLHPHDVFRATEGSYLYPGLGANNVPGADERHLFPGFVTLALAAVGAVALVLSYRRTRLDGHRRRGLRPTRQVHSAAAPAPESPALASRAPPDRRRFIVLLMAVGLCALILAVGAPGGLPFPWLFFYNYVPGFAGIRATGRLAAVALETGAVLAGVGLDTVLRRLPRRSTRVAITAVTCVVVLIELAGPQTWATLPSDNATLAVYRALSHQPSGVVAELPMANPYINANEWSYTEPSRMVWSTIDWHPRLNGYSGYIPPTYPDDANVLATLPSPSAQARLRLRRVRYLILHTGPQTGFQMFTTAQVNAIVAGLPPGTRSFRYGLNYLVVLSSP